MKGNTMSTPMTYTDFAQEVLLKLQVMDKKISKIAAQVDEIYHDDDEPVAREGFNYDQSRPRDDEKVRQLGNQVPYNLIYRPEDIEGFKAFIYAAKRNHQKLAEIEVEYVDRADKAFKDIRLSNQHIRILQGAYTKIYNRPWPFKAKMGYMYKLEPFQLVWEWFD